jgi:pyrroloquinoline quinone biosynthesis protein D
MSNLTSNTIPALAAGYRFQWEEVQQCHVLLYPEGMVQLNETAAAILSFCDGQRNVGEVVATLESEYEAEGLYNDVAEFLLEAIEHGWVRYG